MSSKENKPFNPLWEIRAKFFETDPQEYGLQPTDVLPRVWGVLMETGHEQGPITLLVLADRTVSLYLPTGGGFIGMGGLKPVWAAAKAMLETAEAVFDAFVDDSDRLFPAQGGLRFHLLTHTGSKMAEGVEQEIGKGTGPLSVLFWAGQAVISQMRLASQARDQG